MGHSYFLVLNTSSEHLVTVIQFTKSVDALLVIPIDTNRLFLLHKDHSDLLQCTIGDTDASELHKCHA